MSAEEVERCFGYIETAENYLSEALKAYITVPMTFDHALQAAQTYALLAIANAQLAKE